MLGILPVFPMKRNFHHSTNPGGSEAGPRRLHEWKQRPSTTPPSESTDLSDALRRVSFVRDNEKLSL